MKNDCSQDLEKQKDDRQYFHNASITPERAKEIISVDPDLFKELYGEELEEA
ncbi:hypothetical protein [Bacillus sp. B-jedd]|uniref:hypothetical protein n=1 Tax=Bacillus sp. B-jedd TaxID=1476857 RepID=UPI0012E09C0F|nr:hypothetical protein [Bacillus sp. B-jedd]